MAFCARSVNVCKDLRSAPLAAQGAGHCVRMCVGEACRVWGVLAGTWKHLPVRFSHWPVQHAASGVCVPLVHSEPRLIHSPSVLKLRQLGTGRAQIKVVVFGRIHAAGEAGPLRTNSHCSSWGESWAEGISLGIKLCCEVEK